MAFLTVVLLLALAVFAGRLVYVQGLRGSSIAEEARNSRLVSVALLGGRGEITDADGKPLATSVERYDISVNQMLVADVPGTLNPPVPDGAAGVAAILAPLLDMNAAELGGALVGDRQFVYIRKGVLPEVAREIRKLRASAGSTWTGSPSASTRTAPWPATSSGSSTPTVSGLAGLEASLDDRV